jgi:uncharacterized membrane protein
MSWAARFQLRQRVRQSLWVLPLLGSLVGAGLTWVDLQLEGVVDLPGGWSYSASTATALLTAVAGAMVGLLGLIVTIGVLVVQMATGTLSPRFMRLWYRDRLQKLTLAAFTGTFAFSYGLLRNVNGGSVPDFGVTMAGVIVTIDLIILLLFLNRFVHALRPVAVGAAMAKAGLHVIEELKVGTMRPSAEGSGVLPDGRRSREVLAKRSGAIMAVHVTGIVRLASREGLVCVLSHPVGDFVTGGDLLMEVHGEATPTDLRRLRGMVALGVERTIDQDPAFALRIMVDVAIRALSPAVNDPTTASQMLDHIGAMLAGMGAWDPGVRGEVLGPDGAVRLLTPTRTWEDYLDLGVTEIRYYGRSSPQTCRRLRAMLNDLEAAVVPANRPAVKKQLVALDRLVLENFPDETDRAFAMTSDDQGLGGASTWPGTGGARGIGRGDGRR